VKNSWISFVIPELIGLLVLLSLVPAAAAKRKQVEPEDLTNFLLSPEYSRWLVGPIAHMSTADEVEEFLALESDEQAEAFIKRFWDRRGGEAVFPVKGLKVIFDERVAAADKFYTEGTHRGSRTARGTVLVLFGAPEEVRYELPPRKRLDSIEVWTYPEDAAPGLNGRTPEREYRFIKAGDLTVLYRGPVSRQFRG
jgi:GWxTD domain-containing protein